ncbi:MAG: hypothetical protein BWK76_12675 [Desulfobulbaceae bacterium A2]|nr:MAG: hypothetical protein BWK76_12675 [Desulfobulbaceae bacterium A2]
MERIGAYEAKTNLGKLLERVSRGERFVITRHGVAAAVLLPPGTLVPRDLSEIVAEIKANRQINKLEDITIQDLIDETWQQ